MKNKQSTIFKWLTLAVCLLASGVFYSCSSRDTAQKVLTGQENRSFQAESVPEISEEEVPVDSSQKQERTKAEDTEDAGLSVESETEEILESEEPKLCYVYLCGEVFNPGVYTLPEGSRIYEAVDLAGGFTDQAADSWLNLAEPVTDGMKLEVPSAAQLEDSSWLAKNRYGTDSGNANKTGMTEPGAALVNINTASLDELMTLKGIGASRAEDIIRYRKEAGGFTKIEDIMKVPGIKDAAFQKIKENITV